MAWEPRRFAPTKAIVRSSPETGPNNAKHSEPSGIQDVRYGRIEAVYVATSPVTRHRQLRLPAGTGRLVLRAGIHRQGREGARWVRKRATITTAGPSIGSSDASGEQTPRRLCNVNQASRTGIGQSTRGGQRQFRATSHEAWIGGGNLLDGRLHNPQRAWQRPATDQV